jgi:hypothetical protein
LVHVVAYGAELLETTDSTAMCAFRIGCGVRGYFVMICRVAIKRECMMVRGVCVRYGRLRYHMLFRKSPSI